jgi:hypothetical protein
MIQLTDVLDFILNRCSLKELEAVAAAVERKKEQFQGGDRPDPEQFARQMSKALTGSIDESIAGIQNSFRDYARDLVRRESPDLPPEQAEALVRGLVPDAMRNEYRLRNRQSGGASERGGVERASIQLNGMPPDVVREMALQFAAFSVGRMPPEEDASLRQVLGEWPGVYWNAFPKEIRGIIKSYLENDLGEDAFLASIAVFLS